MSGATTARGFRRVEEASIGIVGVLLAWSAWRMAGEVPGSLLLAGAVVGFIGADLVSGVVHWLADTWGRADMPVLGPALLRPFREHHVDPEAITRHDFVETNGASCLVASPVLLGCALLPLDRPGLCFTAAAGTSLVFWVMMTNQFHKWAHLREVPAPIAWLQRLHLVLPKEHHQAHHTAPFCRNYCITVGWLNGPLDRLGLFPALERLISRLTGAIPRQDDLGRGAALAVASALEPQETAPGRPLGA